MEDSRQGSAGTPRGCDVVGDNVGDVEGNHRNAEVEEEDTHVGCAQGDSVVVPVRMKTGATKQTNLNNQETILLSASV